MDDATSGGFNQTEARLRLNLAGQTQVNLSFWWKDFGDETHTQDGIYFSNNGGTSYVKVYSLNGGQLLRQHLAQRSRSTSTRWPRPTGLALTSTFVVKFQQYDDYPITTDGIAFDDISVTVAGGGGGGDHRRERAQQHARARPTVRSAPALAVTGSDLLGLRPGLLLLRRQHRRATSTSRSRIGIAAPTSTGSSTTRRSPRWRAATRPRIPEVGNYNAAAGHYYLMVDGYLSATSSYTLTVNGGLANVDHPGAEGRSRPASLDAAGDRAAAERAQSVPRRTPRSTSRWREAGHVSLRGLRRERPRGDDAGRRRTRSRPASGRVDRDATRRGRAGGCLLLPARHPGLPADAQAAPAPVI